MVGIYVVIDKKKCTYRYGDGVDAMVVIGIGDEKWMFNI